MQDREHCWGKRNRDHKRKPCLKAGEGIVKMMAKRNHNDLPVGQTEGVDLSYTIAIYPPKSVLSRREQPGKGISCFRRFRREGFKGISTRIRLAERF
jgi:hypothetical protein